MLETPRLRLRRLRPSDEPDLLALDSDPAVMRYVGSPAGVRSPEETLDRVRQRIAGDHGAHGWWVIEGREPPVFHGLALLLPMPDGDGLEVGYRLERRSWGQGLATEAAAAVIDYAFGALRLPALAAVAYEANIASRRVLTKLGFDDRGPSRYRGARVVRYRLTAAAWRRSTAPPRAGADASPGRETADSLTSAPSASHNRPRSTTSMATSSVFLVTGGAGFIGSHIAERLLAEGHRVRVFDNFSTGSIANLAFAKRNRRLEVLRGDLRNLKAVERAVRGVTAVFHQAAMRSVPRSVADPLGTNAANVTGTLHVLYAAAHQRKKPRVVWASSSSVYGERPDLPKREEQSVAPISPYAASKAAGELYAAVWSRLYGVETVALRYFNVFGPRQDPKSEYAAVIPRFILWGSEHKPLQVHGDGTQSRDFTYIDNVVSANLLAARAPAAAVSGKAYNVGCGSRTSLLEIISMLEQMLGHPVKRKHTPPRVGDVPHTLADISLAKQDFGYTPLVDFGDGLRRTVEFFTGRKIS